MSNFFMLIVDGYSILYRGYYAYPAHLSLANGFPINALFGFSTLLFSAIEKFKPTHLCVCLDSSGPTFRNDLYNDYKGTRKETPDDLKEQIKLLESILNGMGVAYIRKMFFEADDLIGTLSSYVVSSFRDSNICILSGDKDILQLVSPNVTVALTKKGLSRLEMYTPDKVFDLEGITPKQVVDFKALCGDVSDNIPGVAGIGPKTASRLLNVYGSLDDIYLSLDLLTFSEKKKIIAGKDRAFLSYKLAKINKEVPINLSMDSFKFFPNWNEILDIFTKYSFQSLVKKYAHYRSGVDDLAVILEKLKVIAIDASDLKAKLEKAVYIDWKKESTEKPVTFFFFDGLNDFIYTCSLCEESFIEIKEFMEDVSLIKYLHDAKGLYRYLKSYDISLEGVVFDTYLAAYLISSGDDYKFSSLCLQYLDCDISAKTITYNVYYLQKLTSVLKKKIDDDTALSFLLYQCELPLTFVIGTMEDIGVCVDKAYLKNLEKNILLEIDDLKHIIYTYAGVSFNINSPKQLAEILYDKLELPCIKKGKMSRTTEASVLGRLAKSYPIAKLLLRYRLLEKLRNTYIVSLQKFSDQSGRIHANFNQAGTVTGRLSSSSPNLQNLPIKTEEGRKVRRAFIASSEDRRLLVFDYSQVELRIVAYLSQDKAMLDLFLKGGDIHRSTAALLAGISEKSVNPDQRRNAKAVNFGILYGMSAFSLAEQLDISRSEAQKIIDGYFNAFPKIQAFIEETLVSTKKLGFSSTLFGRRRYIPEIESRSVIRRSMAERMAINTRIQGTAADIIKLAMVDVDKFVLKRRDVSVLLILQVHDELVFDVAIKDIPFLSEEIKNRMKNIVNWNVDLDVSVYSCYNMH